MNQLPPPLTLEILESFVHGELDPQDMEMVMGMAMNNPEVAAALDLQRRKAVAKVIDQAKAADAGALIASGILEAYFQGGLTDEERQYVELMSRLHPEVGDELRAVEEVHLFLMAQAPGGQLPKPRSKDRFMNFMDMESDPSTGKGVIRPPYLNAASKPEDYLGWTSQFGASPAYEYESTFVQPIDSDPECLTLIVWVKHQIAGEVHLDAVEKFLVLEGTCMIDIEGEEFALKAGDYMSIPKFKEHTVYVTSETPCKLIVQQIAA